MLLKAEFQQKPIANSPVARVIAQASRIILGKETQVRLALACMLARGHLLIEDLPGVGKTTLAHVLARFPLPDSQLDRSTMRIELGYPDHDAERALLSGTDRRDMLATLDPCMSPAELMELQMAAQKIHVAPALLDYVQAIVAYTRRS